MRALVESADALTDLEEGFSWKKTSDSGAEFKYYEVTLSPVSHVIGALKDAWGGLKSFVLPSSSTSASSEPPKYSALLGSFSAEVISPAEQWQIDRAKPFTSLKTITETPEVR
jgi:hypothetical protein